MSYRGKLISNQVFSYQNALGNKAGLTEKKLIGTSHDLKGFAVQVETKRKRFNMLCKRFYRPKTNK